MDEMEHYERWDRVWQRVSPELDPYPEVRAQRQEAGDTPPGASVQLGTFLEEVRRMERRYGWFGARGPAGARRVMGQLAGRCRRQAEVLGALYFVVTGERYRFRLAAEEMERISWREALRVLIRETEEGRRRALAAAKSCGEGCLGEAFTQLAAQWKEQREVLLRLLEKNILA